MKICVVSTWLPYCDGIALYSAKLHKEIAKYAQVQIVANKTRDKHNSRQKTEGKNVTLHRSWARGNLFCLLQILNETLRSRANVVHIHFGWLLYGGPIFALFFPIVVLLLRLNGKHVVITLHTVIRRDARIYGNGLSNRYANILIFAITSVLVSFSSKIIVHNRLMKRTLEETYGCKKEQICIIPHGVEKAIRRTRRKTSENASSLKGCRKTDILSFGFLRRDKGFEFLIEAFQKLQETYPNTRLILVGSPHPHDDGKYAGSIKDFIVHLKTEGNVVLKQFVPEDTLSRIVFDSDIVALMSQKEDFVESSGALARVADFEKPIICNRVPKFLSELTDGYDCLMVDPENSTQIFDAVEMLLREEILKKRIASNLKMRCRSRYWNEVAKQHMKLYRSFF